MSNKDFRPEDIKKLKEKGIDIDWELEWENNLSAETYDIEDINQKLWHLSRLSYLAGYNRGKK